MAQFYSEKSRFQITDINGTLRDISVDVREVTGLPGPRDMLDVTTLAAGGHQWLPALDNVVVTLSGVYSNVATTGIATIMRQIRMTTGTPSPFAYGPEGTTSGQPKITGTGWVENYEEPSRVGNAITWTASLKVHGTINPTGTY